MKINILNLTNYFYRLAKSISEKTKCFYEGCLLTSSNPEEEFFSSKKFPGEFSCPRHSKRCEECGDIFPIGEVRRDTISKSFCCDSCLEDLYSNCTKCNKVIHTSEIVRDKKWNKIGCHNCLQQCEDCEDYFADDDFNSVNHGQKSICDACYSSYSSCDNCKEPTDDYDLTATYDKDKELCPACYTEYENTELKPRTCFYCDEVFDEKLPLDIDQKQACNKCKEEKYTAPKAFTDQSFTADYSKYDYIFLELKKLLPISVSYLKKNYPAIANTLKDLISFVGGQTLTSENVDQFRATLPKRNFQVSYSGYNFNTQRTIKYFEDFFDFLQTEDVLPLKISDWKKDYPQSYRICNQFLPHWFTDDNFLTLELAKEIKKKGINSLMDNSSHIVLNINLSDDELNSLSSLARQIFDSGSELSKEKGHPSTTNQMGWVRLELFPEKKYFLVDEVQSDQQNFLFKNKKIPEKNPERFNQFLQKHQVTKEDVFNAFREINNLVKDFPDVAMKTIFDFARQNGYTKVYYHTLEGMHLLKENDPPKSLYTLLPEKHFFIPTEYTPVNLPAKFYIREARNKIFNMKKS